MSDDDPMVDVDMRCDKATADRLNKMTKADLRGVIVALSLRNQVQDETVAELEAVIDKQKNELSKLNTKVDTAESYVAQARAMIDAVVDRWDEYDV